MSTIIPVRRSRPLTVGFGDFDSVFGDIFDSLAFNQSLIPRKSVNTVPLANIYEVESGYEINLAAPGLSRSDFKISVENNALTVSTNSDSDTKSEKYNEFNYNSFKRSWSLPKDTNAELITANYNAGILNIAVPTETKKKQTVNVSVS